MGNQQKRDPLSLDNEEAWKGLKDTRAKEPNPQPRTSKRPPLPARIKWDASQGSEAFESWSASIRSHFLQTNGGYLLDEDFQMLYLEHGLEAVNHWHEPISMGTFKNDLNGLFGAVDGALSPAVSKSDRIKFAKNSGGIRLWLAIQEEHGRGGARRTG